MSNGNEKIKKSGIFSKIIEAIIYILIINLSYVMFLYIDIYGKYDQRNIEAYKDLWIFITLASLFIFLFNKMFQTLKLSKTENSLIVITSTVMIGITVTFIAFIFRSFALPRSVIFQSFIFQTIILIIIKFCMKFIFDKTKKVKDVALFCTPDLMKEAIERLFGSAGNFKERLIFVSDLEKFDNFCLSKIDKVYIYDIYSSELLENAMHECILQGIPVCIAPKSYELAMTKSNFYLIADVPLIKIDRIGLSFEYRVMKRIVDIVFSIIAIIIFAPIMLIVAFVLLVFDGGHILYKQRRVTLNNKEFYVYKFRTMKIDAEKETGAVWAIEDDPRITKVGSVLRKYWLDELPQLFNVLRGDMSVVGPRPERPELIKEFVKEYPEFKYRTLVKGGLTGYAQVMAKYETTPPYKLKFDLFYILNSNILFDFNIIVMTLRKIFLRLINNEKKALKYEELIKKWNVLRVEKDDNMYKYIYIDNEKL